MYYTLHNLDIDKSRRLPEGEEAALPPRLPCREVIRLLSEGPRPADELAAAGGADPDGVARQLAAMSSAVPDLVREDGDCYRLGPAGQQLADVVRRELQVGRREAALDAAARQSRTPSVRVPKTAIGQRAAEREITPERLAKGDVGEIDAAELKRLRLDTEHRVDRPSKKARDPLDLMSRRNPKTGKPNLTQRQLAAGRRVQELADLARLDRLPALDPAACLADGGSQRVTGLTDQQADALATINRVCKFVERVVGSPPAAMVRAVLVDGSSLEGWFDTRAARGLPKRRSGEYFREALDLVADALDEYGGWGREGPPLGDEASPCYANGAIIRICT